MRKGKLCGKRKKEKKRKRKNINVQMHAIGREQSHKRCAVGKSVFNVSREGES